MRLSEIQHQALHTANEFGFAFFILDRTAHTINIRIIIDHELFIQIYANSQKEKLNLSLIFHGNRIYGHDKEGGIYHLHPFENPDRHTFTNSEKSVREFVLESMLYLEEKGLL